MTSKELWTMQKTPLEFQTPWDRISHIQHGIQELGQEDARDGRPIIPQLQSSSNCER